MLISFRAAILENLVIATIVGSWEGEFARLSCYRCQLRRGVDKLDSLSRCSVVPISSCNHRRISEERLAVMRKLKRMGVRDAVNFRRQSFDIGVSKIGERVIYGKSDE